MHRIFGSQAIATAVSRLPRVVSGEIALSSCGIRRRGFHLNGYLQNPTWVKMPSLSPTMSEGSIVQWNKKEGEEVQSGDVLCEVQTDKAVVALECEEDGVLAKILVAEKAPNVQVGSMIAVIANPDENWEEVAKSAAAPPQAAPTKAEPEPQQQSSPELQPTAQAATVTSGPIKAGPAARLLIQNHGLDSAKIPASGPRGNLLKEDVLGYLQSHPTAATQPVTPSTAQIPVPGPLPTTASFIDIPLTNMRQTIAKRLTMSKTTIPHAFVRATARLDRVMDLRQAIKSRLGLKLSVNDIIIKACALGLRLVPDLNAITDPSNGGSLLFQPTVDICMAVATPAGLITPILRNADRMPISEVASSATTLAKRARDGKLQPNEFQGGTFTISNLGMFGIREFTAIINPPQVAILAVGSGMPRPVGTLPECSKSVRFANTLTLTLSIDSRYIDEAMAGRFLTHVSRLLTDHPELLLSDDSMVQAGLGGQSVAADHFETLILSTSGMVAAPSKAVA